jgi:hypothetical protein
MSIASVGTIPVAYATPTAPVAPAGPTKGGGTEGDNQGSPGLASAPPSSPPAQGSGLNIIA